MFAICIESSHAKGMGHLFRMINFAEYLKKQNQEFIFFLNDNEKAKNILDSKNFKYECVCLDDFDGNWESRLILKYNITHWVNDRLETDEKHSLNVAKNRCKLITFDDLGSGAVFSDLNICGLFFNADGIKGKNILSGTKYLILNPEIEQYKKERNELKNILVTLGGSDTYGVTIKVLKLLKKYNIKATIHIGPSFEHINELKSELNSDYEVVSFVPSLIQLFSKFDLAITGGGVTPFEANASGLPCLIIANELFEIPNGKYLESLGSSLFLGFHEVINEITFKNLKELKINSMSMCGLSRSVTDASENIYAEIVKL